VEVVYERCEVRSERGRKGAQDCAKGIVVGFDIDVEGGSGSDEQDREVGIADVQLEQSGDMQIVLVDTAGFALAPESGQHTCFDSSPVPVLIEGDQTSLRPDLVGID
jgi:hypothetical protein